VIRALDVHRNLESLWPDSADELERLQLELAVRWRRQPAWFPPTDRPPRVGGVFVASPRGGFGLAGEPAWVAAVVLEDGSVLESTIVQAEFAAAYMAGLLAMREGRLLAEAVQSLETVPDVLIVNASGRDHPRRAGLALHLGAACDLPTIGVTDRPLLASGAEPGPRRSAVAALVLESEVVGYRLRTRAGARAVVVHAGWRVDAETACAVVLQSSRRSRTPAPLREARRLARTARSAS
jgi:deoxyribonuclease V